jgi:hypothetical protein
VDRIINLGEYWDASLLKKNRADIQKLTDLIGLSFQRAYNRLAESKLAFQEWKSYLQEARDEQAVKRNIRRWRKNFYMTDLRPEAAASFVCWRYHPAGLLPG